MSPQFLEEEILLNSIQLALHAEAYKLGDVRSTLGDEDVFASDNTTVSQGRDLVHLVLFTRAFRAHSFALGGQFA